VSAARTSAAGTPLATTSKRKVITAINSRTPGRGTCRHRNRLLRGLPMTETPPTPGKGRPAVPSAMNIEEVTKIGRPKADPLGRPIFARSADKTWVWDGGTTYLGDGGLYGLVGARMAGP